MNVNEILEIKKQILDMSENIKKLENLYKGLNAENKTFLKANKQILPGSAHKVFYDKNGIILKGENLTVDDIPILNIHNINNLEERLNSKIDTLEFNKFKESSSEKQKLINPGTGTKINYDKYGRIISSSELIVHDIPELPLSKIQGLADRFSLIETSLKSKDPVKTKVLSPGTYTKITFDETGLVRSGEFLTLNDLPVELITRLNVVESKLVDFASKQVVDTLKSDILKKLDSNTSIMPGEYTKIFVDSKGLVTKGDKLAIKDLPVLNIENIRNLDQSLRSKCSQDNYVELYNAVRTIMNRMNNNPELATIKTDLDNKVSKSEMSILTNQVENLERTLEKLAPKLPSDYIEEMMVEIRSTLTSLSGRVHVLEEKTINKNFD